MSAGQRQPRDRGSHAPDRSASESPLSASWRPSVWERAILVGLAQVSDDEVLEELDRLARAAGAEPVGRVVQVRNAPDPATFVGKGKVAEVQDLVHATCADAVIFDEELSPGQLRNLEERLGMKVLDRTALILDIFALHARSGEGKAQVELAQLNYLLPRLRGWGEAMSRLGGGIGTRGPGETKIEMDRQHIRRTDHQAAAGHHRPGTHAPREARGPRAVGPAAGGAGRLHERGEVHAAERPDRGGRAGRRPAVRDARPTTRRLTLPGGRQATLSDTVGFVRKLPHELVEAFKSTLEEVALGDLILHVADASAPDLTNRSRRSARSSARSGRRRSPRCSPSTSGTCVDEAGRARLGRRLPDGVPVSALPGTGSRSWGSGWRRPSRPEPSRWSCSIPFDRADVIARLHREGEVLSTDVGPEATRVEARVDERLRKDLAGLVQTPKAGRVRA